MIVKFGFPVRFIIISIFITAVSFLFLLLFPFSFSFSYHFLDRAFAQSFVFHGTDAAVPVTTGFTFLKNSGGSILYPQIYQGRLWFAETLTLEKPPYVQFTFLSDNYTINSIKTSPEVIKIIKGEAVANSSSVYKIYLNIKNHSGLSYNSYQNQNNRPNSNTTLSMAGNTSGPKFNFGYNPNLPNANNAINQSQPRAVSPPQQPAIPAAQGVNNTARGSVYGYVTGNSTTFGGGSVIVNVTNANNQFIKSQIVNTEPGGSVYPYTISGIPPILPGSNDYYKISVTSNNGFQPVQYPQSNIKIYGAGQVVQAQPIVMQARYGKLNITLYHGRPAPYESEQSLSELARNAVINISGTASTARFISESPARFYRYAIDSAPAGKRQLSIMFPGHGLSGGSLKEVSIPADSSASVLYNLSEN